jgi:outer membrane lipoprotein-sorting protein
VKRFHVFTAAIVAAILLAGCAPKRDPNLPAYHWVDDETALADLRTRAAALKTLSSQCAITLTGQDGRSVQVDGVLVVERPNHVRLRTWKFDRAVFDLTLNDDGLWVVAMDDPARREQIMPATVRAGDFVKHLSLFTGGFFLDDPPPRVETHGDTLVLTKAIAEGQSLHCDADRQTLTPRRFYSESASGERFELLMKSYRDLNGVLWPMRLEATSAMGRVIVEQRDVEINGELAAGAFVPPKRAERRQ